MLRLSALRRDRRSGPRRLCAAGRVAARRPCECLSRMGNCLGGDARLCKQNLSNTTGVTMSLASLELASAVDDKFLAIIILTVLQKNNALAMALEHSSSEITSETVIAALLKEGNRKETPSSSSYVQDTALSVQKKKFVDLKTYICTYCKKRDIRRINVEF
ncbi:hypothetical protein ACJJTC_001391 [Scirpophaga incertulas]